MKIRILDNHIRLRLEPDEVELVASGQTLRSVTRFPSGAAFGYQLAGGGNVPHADFENGTISILLPLLQLKHWATDQRAVSIRESIAGSCLTILVEKDFECLEPRPGESQKNRFRRELIEAG